MTPELASVEDFFLRISRAAAQPWPPDRKLGALARMRFVQAILDGTLDAFETQMDRVDAARRAFDLEMALARELHQDIIDWCTIAEALAFVAAQTEGSPIQEHGL